MIKLTKNFSVFIAILLIFATSLFFATNVASASAQNLPTTARANVLVDYGSGQVLAENNSFAHLPIASVTKLTTLLLTFEAVDRGEIQLDQKLTASKNSAGMGGSQVFIDEGGEYAVLDLLHAIIISSANDASVMIAEELAGSEANFVELMNERVRKLGGTDTNYTNCTGLPSANAYSCAHDVALVMREVLSHPLYFEISGIWMEDFLHPTGRVTQMANTNKLLRTYSGCDAGKTGSTSEAGYCLSATAKRGDMRLISVVLGAENSKARFEECSKLLDFGFDNFVSERILSANEPLELNLAIHNAKVAPQVIAEKDYQIISQRGKAPQMSVEFVLDSISAPKNAGDIVGKAIITNNGVVVTEINLILKNDVPAKSLWDNIHSITQNW